MLALKREAGIIAAYAVVPTGFLKLKTINLSCFLVGTYFQNGFKAHKVWRN